MTQLTLQQQPQGRLSPLKTPALQSSNCNTGTEEGSREALRQAAQALSAIEQTIESDGHHLAAADTLRTQLSIMRDAHTQIEQEFRTLREKLARAEDENFLLAQRLRREQEKFAEQRKSTVQAEIDDEILMERTLTMQRRRSASNASHCGSPPTTPTLLLPGFRNGGGSSATATSPSERSPLQQLLNSNFNSPPAAAGELARSPPIRFGISPSAHHRTQNSAGSMSSSAPQLRFLDRYMAASNAKNRSPREQHSWM